MIISQYMEFYLTDKMKQKIVFIFSNNQIDTISKLSLIITRHWIESINATMQGDVHRTWGHKDNKTGMITGFAGQLQRKEADIGGRHLDIGIN